MKIIQVAKSGRDYISDKLIAENVNENYGKFIVKKLNERYGEYYSKYYELVEDDYELYKSDWE